MHEHFNKHVLDKIFVIDIKSVSDEGMLAVAIVTIVVIAT